MVKYVVVGSKPWNKRVFDRRISKFPGEWYYFSNEIDLQLFLQKKRNKPKYIFFLHWSRLVPKTVVENYECVCFHMTDVPFGRGGSPLQNLIKEGYRKTKLTALRMTNELDAGDVYDKQDLCLEGNAEEIYIRATGLSAQMIRDIIHRNPKPVPQEGRPVVYLRRTPEQSEITDLKTLTQIYDHIRMLDAENYPHAFIIHEGYKYTFKRAGLYDGKIKCDVIITKEEE